MAHNNLIAYTYRITGPGIDPGANGAITLEKILSQTIGVLTLVAAIYFAFQIIFAGYSFMSANGDEKAMNTARKRLTDGVLGITIIVAAIGVVSLLTTLAGIPNIFNINSAIDKMF